MKRRFKIVQSVGATPSRPGVWYTHKSDAEQVYSECVKYEALGKPTWASNTLKMFRTGELKFNPEEYDEEDPTTTWYGVVLDEEPERNEFGEVSP